MQSRWSMQPGSCDGVAREVVCRGVAPQAAAACAVRRGGRWALEASGGDALFDLASLTKPMCAAAIAACGGRPGLAASTLAAALPELGATRTANVAIELLLAHRAGLEANLPLFLPLLRGDGVDRHHALIAAADAQRAGLGARPVSGHAPLYSDLGYILAGAALARACSAPDAGDAIDAKVFAPLGIADVGSVRALRARGVDVAARAAPTEVVSWRGEVRGEVHDENAWALTGDGASGHAGLFGTARGVLRFGMAVLDDLPRLAWLVEQRPGGTLRAGFDGKSENGYSSAGTRMGPRAFGHLGFTGTSLWIDPDAEVVVVLLTNRVHPTRESAAIREARPLAHDALVARACSLVP